MSETKHTPGPWSWWPDSCGGMVTQDKTALHIACPNRLVAYDANGRLMAAAPDLLAACEELEASLVIALNVIADNGMTGAFVAQCQAKGIKNGVGVRGHAAIAKARGESRCWHLPT